MILGFFAGKTVNAVNRKAQKAIKAVKDFQGYREQAIADRQAAIRVASDEISTLQSLSVNE